MVKSARILGKDYGLTAQEMNQLLKDQGFLDGNPGEYFVTEKGAPFAKEIDFHRGSGGYAQYNRYWTERTWDESIKDVLDTSAESRDTARAAVAEARRIKWDKIKTDRAEAEAAFRASRPDLFPVEMPTEPHPPSDQSSNGWATAGKVASDIGLAALAGYGIYKAAPHIKKWWCEKVVPFFKGEEKE